MYKHRKRKYTVEVDGNINVRVENDIERQYFFFQAEDGIRDKGM